MVNPPIFVGIDLGTSNSALAYLRPSDSVITQLPILQINQIGQLSSSALLPSLSYLPLAEERSGLAATVQNYQFSRDFVVGSYAKSRAGQVPDRVVTSAKSWLCNPQVDRLAEILPWQASCEKKLSPLTALQGYLHHLCQAALLDQELASLNLNWQEVPTVLTVPASFDEVARNLTHRAAEQAGLGNLTLLEEPLAAMYAWLAHHEDSWRDQVWVGDLILVCDVGGGTTDFSLIAVSVCEGCLQLERVSVGEHLLLGGDNMDLALAHFLQAKLLAERQVKLDHWQFQALIASAREAKELLLGEPQRTEVTLAIAGKGSRLMAQSLSVSLSRGEIEQIFLDGFFPLVAADDEPLSQRESAIQEFGLPYAADPAISRQLVGFLRRSRQAMAAHPTFSTQFAAALAAQDQVVLPTAMLFNGGVFNAELLQQRMLSLLHAWQPNSPIKLLSTSHLDLAVSQGAAYFAKHKALGKGIRIKAGTAKSYYVGVESSMMAIPGIRPPLKGLCVVPQGSEEGSSFTLTGKVFGLAIGRETKFRFFSSSLRPNDQVGTAVEDGENELDEATGLQITLAASAEAKAGEVVPVELHAAITEVGTLTLFMKHLQSAKSWQIDFNVR